MSVRTATRLAQSAVLLVLPHGGQQAARRNAWAGMAADSARGRARREADAAMTAAVRAHELQAAAAR